MKHNVLIVEDEVPLRHSLRKLLRLRQFEVDEAGDYRSAEALLRRQDHDIYILDLKLPDKNGIQLLEAFPNKMAGKTIVITAHATIPSAVKAIKNGAFYYLEKPFDEELLFIQMTKILEFTRLKKKNVTLKQELLGGFAEGDIVYRSRRMADVMNQAQRVAGTQDIVIIQGETGVGKEVIAHYVHQNSNRAGNIFLPINCSSVPEHLFESELFGFRRGAFTGANKDYNGRFIQANKGTLFLDEISDMPMQLQAKLLRVLDDQVVYQLGNKQPQQIDVRLITATNRDLWKEVDGKRFRKDLYYRLRESVIEIPPLRERKEDILLLFRHFMHIFSEMYDKEISEINQSAQQFLQDYYWEGNVRELKNAVKSIFSMKDSGPITTNDLMISLREHDRLSKSQFTPLEEHEGEYIKKVLRFNNYNIKRTAEILKISRSRLYRKMDTLGLRS